MEKAFPGKVTVDLGEQNFIYCCSFFGPPPQHFSATCGHRAPPRREFYFRVQSTGQFMLGLSGGRRGRSTHKARGK